MSKDFHKKITYFSEEKLLGISVPENFTYPFFYTPDTLTQLAMSDLQNYLEHYFTSSHNFGLNEEQEGLVIGKMFGVLVVRDSNGKLGYLSAFSGKLAGKNEHERFVPPVFDMLTENSFFKKEEKILNEMTAKIESIEKHPDYWQLQLDFKEFSTNSTNDILVFKHQMKSNKAERKIIREREKERLSETEYAELEADLIKQSYRDQYELKVKIQNQKEKTEDFTQKIEVFEQQIEQLKKERREKSSELQNQLFAQYSFLNQFKKNKSLGEIFKETVFEKPPAAAGECATPKLLQYAFLHDLQPISFAEFWWGASPKSEIRQHKQHYPACSGKCRPILKHMLDGIKTDENPLLIDLAEDKKLKIIYEDEEIVVVNKPAELLSIPGIEIQNSVYTQLQEGFQGIEPLIIHRLDMSTSGLLVVAKTKEAHKYIQKQFIKKTVKKRYTALLSAIIEEEEGLIELPLRPNILNRPRQMVCFEKGKKSITKWKVMERNETKTKVHFWPITGRTHQLRVHAAHPQGLNAPIVGDDLYGSSDSRLFLHAAFLEFRHPKTREIIQFEAQEDF
ncbi:MAG: pseudouridine synthase [Weeksellaceae bacterium]|jgi:tRNA pseudouridine32 synthase/23S rRNA pseudouridine746 synthase|nr:pseudouridine synthase [Weeksellaceae bacterium]